MNGYGAMVEWFWQGKIGVPWEKQYTVGGRWMNVYRAMVEWYWQGKYEVLGEKHYTAGVVDGLIWNICGMILTGENWNTGRKTLYSVGCRWMDMEQWWNDTDKWKLKYLVKNIKQRGL